jgi:hypothetical protein
MDTVSDGQARRSRRPTPERTSEVLATLAQGEGERVAFRDIVAELKHRAVGFTTLVFALPCVLPMPPGIPTLCGIALCAIGINLLAARRRLWLPRAIADKSIARSDLNRIIYKAVPYMRKLERFCKPRLPLMTESVGKVFIGLVLLVLGFIMILPIPFIGNMPPGFAASVIALGVTERDGLVVLVGLLVSAAAVALASAGTWAAIVGIIQYFAGS